MKPIIQLEQPLIDKIAAGEVVERPLSVVKELTENAIDAGASVVTVEIADGGLAMIRVTDNGGGIPADQLSLAFARHATSKITCADDLFAVRTLGFRGEALSSIAAVAQVELITKPRRALTGVRLEMHGGRFVDRREVGCADGTTVVVSNLFYNVPARRKFLKKPSTEAGYISDCLQKLALGNPGLGIRYIANGQLVFQTNGNGDLRTALLNVYGREAAGKVIQVAAEKDTLAVRGLVGKPEAARGNRGHGTFFINGRYVYSKLLGTAVEAAFKTLLPSGRFPLYVLHLTLDAGALDVNVHPTKMEVRFADEGGVCAFVQDAVREALGEHALAPAVRLGDNRFKAVYPEEEQLDLREAAAHSKYRPLSTRPDTGEGLSLREGPLPTVCGYLADDYLVKPAAAITETPEPPPFFSDYRIMGLLFGTYWLVTQGTSLYAIDQHAAHERILYEEMLHSVRSQSVAVQPLVAPVPLRLTPREAQLLRENEAYFTDLGLTVGWEDKEDGPVLTGVPLLFKGPLPDSFFMEALDALADDNDTGDDIYAMKTECIAMAACKAAVKAGDALSEAEGRALVTRLLALEKPFTCPHGRPTIIEITQRELERRFKRV